MDIQIVARNIDINERAENYISKKFSRLERHLRSLKGAKMEVQRTSSISQDDRVVVQMTLDADGYVLRGQQKGLNLYAAVDAVADVMDRQIEKFKGKISRSEARPEPASDRLRAEEYDPALDEGAVVRTKRFPMKPMAIGDAITQMELLGHSFFLFFNLDTNEYNVVYRREEGDYGVFEPELG